MLKHLCRILGIAAGLLAGGAFLAAPALAQYSTRDGGDVGIWLCASGAGTQANPFTPCIGTEGRKATFSAAAIALAVPTGATDVFCIAPSATQTVRVLRVQVSLIAATLAQIDAVLLRRSTLDTGGTAATGTANPANTIAAHDASDSNTAVLISYTANPTLGTAAGVLRAQKITAQLASAANADGAVVWDFTTRNGKGVVLAKNTTQQACVNLNGDAIAGGAADIDIEYSLE